MDDLIIHWDGEQRSLDADTTVVMGRDPEVDITLDNPHVSRRHVELRPGPGGWVVRDLGSTQGTFVGQDRIEEHPVGDGLVLTLGRPDVGAQVRIEVLEHTTEPSVPTPPSPPTPPTTAAPAAPSPPTGAPMAPPTGPPVPPPPGAPPGTGARPGGELREDELGGATVVTGATLNVECAGRHYEVQPDQQYVVGRDAGADIVSANPTVSRRHASLTREGDVWVLTDLGSSGGMFVEGRKVPRVELRGANAVMLGDPDSGERLVLQAAGERATSVSQRLNRPGRRGAVLAGIALLAVVAVALGAFALLRGDDASDPEVLARASVNLEAGDAGGSGTIVDAEQGLILTNAHVVAPSAEGQGIRRGVPEAELESNPDEILIDVSPGLDRAAEPRYIGEVVAADGYLDLAVVKITKTASGNLIEEDDLDGLVEVPLGNSDDVRTGDDIRVIGYPGISQSAAPTLTEGVVSGTVQDERVGSNRAFISVDADINAGNSGGTAVDDTGDLIGVPTLTAVDLGSETLDQSNRLRPINLAVPLIDAARDDEDYTSEFVTPLEGEVLSEFRVVQTVDAESFVLRCRSAEKALTSLPGSDVLSVSFDYAGFAEGEHQDVRIDVVGPEGEIVGSASTTTEYPFEWDAEGCATASIVLDEPIERGRYVLAIGLGPNNQVTREQNVSLTVR